MKKVIICAALLGLSLAAFGQTGVAVSGSGSDIGGAAIGKTGGSITPGSDVPADLTAFHFASGVTVYGVVDVNVTKGETAGFKTDTSGNLYLMEYAQGDKLMHTIKVAPGTMVAMKVMIDPTGQENVIFGIPRAAQAAMLTPKKGTSFKAFAQTVDNWGKGSSGEVWKTGTESCWRDGAWTPATATSGCFSGGGEGVAL